ncbi:hypothetical protein GPJ56_009129 [Histomonas meleagridis]|uniref:uncharacterized protein n=1 Tax=Histomonas meleagridis TaxID=135588 RepID=UPI00355A7BEE|nr:hypothetical protein GPJ56_009129 [Histomonas meleagridis]KAH0799214.1 hypothetical protein GO595_008011 [Histomonas meleagridis]
MSEKKDLISIQFSAKPGEIVDACSILADAGYIYDGDEAESSKVSLVLQKVQSKMGKIDTAYDEGDGFIDDSEIINLNSQAHTLDPSAFRVVLSYPSTNQAQSNKPTPSKSRPDESKAGQGGDDDITERLSPFIEKIKLVTLAPIEALLDKIASGNSKAKDQKIALAPEMIDAIGQCIDEKVRLETEKLGATPSKKKMDQWRRDACQLIFSQCFTVHEFTFVKSLRTLQNAYKKYNDKKDASANKEAETESAPPVKELPEAPVNAE